VDQRLFDQLIPVAKIMADQRALDSCLGRHALEGGGFIAIFADHRCQRLDDQRLSLARQTPAAHNPTLGLDFQKENL
jgi:hypothetical protein